MRKLTISNPADSVQTTRNSSFLISKREKKKENFNLE